MKKISTLFYILLIAGTSWAQIPNAGFETWTTHTGYDTPDGWGNTNPYTNISSTYTCAKGTSGAPVGTSYIQLTTKNCGVVVPGVAVTGLINLVGTSVSVSGGFAYTSRPATLNGQWQYMAAAGTDKAHIIVFLSKWNTITNKRDTVAFTDSALTGMAMSWASFSINLKYYSGKFPDSAMIILSSSNLSASSAVVGSYLYVDDLAFAGNMPSGVVTINNNSYPTMVFPNPASETANVLYNSKNGGDVIIYITDINGKAVKQINTRTTIGENSFPINIDGLARGYYIVRIEGDQGIETKKMIVE